MRELRMFPTMLRIGFADLLAYRAQVVIWILTTTMPLVMFAMWSTLAREAPVGRFDERTFAGYFLSTLLVRQLSASWIVWELNEHIRGGALSTALLRPVHPLWFFAAENLGAVPFRVVVLAPLAAIAFVMIPDIRVELTAVNLVLYFVTIFLAWVLTFCVQAMIGVLALYTQQSLSLQDAWFGAWAIFSGYLIPLELMPRVHAFALWMPFRAMGSLPTEIILGLLDPRARMVGVATQVAWVVVMLVLLRFVWARAIRRFEAFGG